MSDHICVQPPTSRVDLQGIQKGLHLGLEWYKIQHQVRQAGKIISQGQDKVINGCSASTARGRRPLNTTGWEPQVGRWWLHPDPTSCLPIGIWDLGSSCKNRKLDLMGLCTYPTEFSLRSYQDGFSWRLSSCCFTTEILCSSLD